MVSITGTTEQFQRAVQMIRGGNGFWFVFSVGFTPLPFQIAMVAAGVSGYSLYGFIAATTQEGNMRYDMKDVSKTKVIRDITFSIEKAKE